VEHLKFYFVLYLIVSFWNENFLFLFKKVFNPHLILCFAFLICSIPVQSKVIFQEAAFYQDKGVQKKLTLGKGEIISSDKDIVRVALSDPSIVDLQLLSERQVFLRAKQLGSCTLLIWEKDKASPARFDIQVWPDIAHLTKQLQELDKNIIVEYMPPTYSLSGDVGNPTAPPPSSSEEGGPGGAGGAAAAANVQSAGAGTSITKGRIILRGNVSNAEVIANALQIAGIYVGDTGVKILSLPGGQVVNDGTGSNNLLVVGDGASQGLSSMFGNRDGFSFTSNRLANLSRGTIVTTQQGLVISFLRVANAPQIAVAIRFYEITKLASRGIGINTTFGGNTLQGGSLVGGSGVSSITGSNTSTITGTTSKGTVNTKSSNILNSLGGNVTAAIFNPENGIGLAIQALQERGEIKVLAEPTLIISNGEPASFLAGGEVPVLSSIVTAGGAAQSVNYEPFGIKFTILPTILGNNKIHLQVVPEIRDIDTELSNFVAAGSTALRPPAFKTRRTQTQVELESGEAFAISGLLREDNSKGLRKVPGVGDIPVIGTLFRSKTFRKGETELLVVVSPQIVTPTMANEGSKVTNPPTTAPEYFNQIAPLIKAPEPVKKADEEGPDGSKPIEAERFNNKGFLPTPTPTPISTPTPELKPSPPVIKPTPTPKPIVKKIYKPKVVAPVPKATPEITPTPIQIPSPQQNPSPSPAASPEQKIEQPKAPAAPGLFQFDLFKMFNLNKNEPPAATATPIPLKEKEPDPEIIFKDKDTVDSANGMLMKKDVEKEGKTSITTMTTMTTTTTTMTTTISKPIKKAPTPSPVPKQKASVQDEPPVPNKEKKLKLGKIFKKENKEENDLTSDVALSNFDEDSLASKNKISLDDSITNKKKNKANKSSVKIKKMKEHDLWLRDGLLNEDDDKDLVLN
jgi:Flp pilus assembly secretin CpaC